MQTKELIVVGGSNGAGKTTFADEYVALHCYRYIGADAIATSLSPDDPLGPAVSSLRRSTLRFQARKVSLSNPLFQDVHYKKC